MAPLTGRESGPEHGPTWSVRTDAGAGQKSADGGGCARSRASSNAIFLQVEVAKSLDLNGRPPAHEALIICYTDPNALEPDGEF